MKITDNEKAKIALIAIKNVLNDESVKPITKFRVIRDTCDGVLKTLFVEQRKVTGSQKKD